jgi:hypothetical protein
MYPKKVSYVTTTMPANPYLFRIFTIKKMWYLHTVEFYSAIKKNEILSFSGKRMELENIILSEVS